MTDEPCGDVTMILRPTRRSRRNPAAPLMAVLAAALLALLPAATASAAAPASTAYIRVAHLVPGFGAVTMTATLTSFDGKTTPLTLTPDAAYGAVSQYQSLPVGSYAIAVRPVGAPATSPPVLTATLAATAGGAYTIAGLGSSSSPRIGTIDDDITPPAAGQARMRVIDAAVPGQSATLSLDGTAWASPAQFATPTEYGDVPAGTVSVVASSGGRNTTASVDLVAGDVYTLLLLDDGKGGIAVRSVTDAAGASTTPVGGAATGAGGLATAAPTALPLAVGGASALAGLAGLGVVAHRQRRQRRTATRQAASVRG